MSRYLPAKKGNKYPKRIKKSKIAAAQVHTLNILRKRASSGKSVSNSKLQSIDPNKISKAYLF